MAIQLAVANLVFPLRATKQARAKLNKAVLLAGMAVSDIFSLARPALYKQSTAETTEETHRPLAKSHLRPSMVSSAFTLHRHSATIGNLQSVSLLASPQVFSPGMKVGHSLETITESATDDGDNDGDNNEISKQPVPPKDSDIGAAPPTVPSNGALTPPPPHGEFERLVGAALLQAGVPGDSDDMSQRIVHHVLDAFSKPETARLVQTLLGTNKILSLEHLEATVMLLPSLFADAHEVSVFLFSG
jgi:hypothetical protein